MMLTKNEVYRKLSYKDLIIFLIPFVIFMFYLTMFDPGVLRLDTFTQLGQITKFQFDNWHPFFHTYIEMLCLKIIPNPKSVAILQILTFAVIWTAICNYFRHDDPSIKSNKFNQDFILQIITTLVICLIPINAVYSITLVKDTLFSYFFLLTCFLIKILLDKKGNVGYGFIIIFSLSMAFVSQLRHNGIIVILILLVILAIKLYKLNKEKKLYIILPAATIIFILLIASLNVAYDVADNDKDAVYTKVIHMLADYDLNLTLDNSDRDKIHEVINEKTIKKSYFVYGSDPMYLYSNQSVYDNDKSAFIDMAIKYSLQNPMHFIKYIFDSSPMVWDFIHVKDYGGSAYYIDNTANYARYKAHIPIYENSIVNNEEIFGFKFLYPTINFFNYDSILNELFYSPALYMYLSLILMGGIYLLTKSRDIIYVYLPNVINILLVFASTPIQDYRYLYPNLLLFYLLIIILINVLYENKKQYSPPNSNIK